MIETIAKCFVVSAKAKSGMWLKKTPQHETKAAKNKFKVALQMRPSYNLFL